MKYFAVSDIHSHYKELMTALKQAGFDKDNPEHILIVCGDVFDRGKESIKVYDFLRKLPKERKVLIRGNHEYLLKEAVNREEFYTYDRSNGTVSTVAEFAGMEYLMTYAFSEKACKSFKRKGVWKWLNSDEWVDYFELDRFIFVHSFIPLVNDDNLPSWYVNARRFNYEPNWRTLWADRDMYSTIWEDATWGCPWKLYEEGYLRQENDNGKTLVCGHWHASDFYKNLNKENVTTDNEKEYMKLYYSKDIIALDACTAYSGFCNVLVIDEEFNCYDKFGNKLNG